MMMILMGTTLWLFKNSYGSHGPFTDDKHELPTKNGDFPLRKLLSLPGGTDDFSPLDLHLQRSLQQLRPEFMF
jgi:hypothetical protein